jgi:hypothetical protein
MKQSENFKKSKRNSLEYPYMPTMRKVRWQGKTGGGVGVNAISLAPCVRALAFDLERIGGLQSD